MKKKFFYLIVNKLLLNLKIITLILLLIVLYSCSGKSWELYKANKLLARNDLPSLFEAKKIYEKYSSDLTAREGLKNVNKKIGEVYFYDEKFKDALPYFLESLEIDPVQAETNYYAGVCYANLISSEIIEKRRKDYIENALKHYERAISISPKYETAYYAMGVFYLYQMDDYLEAKKYIEKVLELNPDHIRALFVMGQIYYLMGDKQSSLNIYLDLLKKLPKGDSRIDQVKKNIEQIQNELKNK
ncbi:MAG: tetratricopeptide repeat protein [Spirochaetes bacterium]|nr:tetratricopeptide repeat protein [Spirochaetota bacterium]